GLEFHNFPGIRNIDVDLKKGNEFLSIGNNIDDLTNKAYDLGFGSALGSVSGLASDLGSFASATFQLDKQLKIRMGDGNDGVAINQADIGLRIDADLGNGNN